MRRQSTKNPYTSKNLESYMDLKAKWRSTSSAIKQNKILDIYPRSPIDTKKKLIKSKSPNGRIESSLIPK